MMERRLQRVLEWTELPAVFAERLLCLRGAGVELEDGACRNENLHAPVLRGAQHVFRHALRHVLRHVLRRVLHVPVLHVSFTKGKRGGRHGHVVRGFRQLKMAMGKISTSALPSSAAPSTSSAKSFTCGVLKKSLPTFRSCAPERRPRTPG